MPTAIEQIDDRIGYPGHFGFVLAKALNDADDVAQHLGAVELEVIRRQSQIGPLLLQNMRQPVGELDVAVTGALGKAKRLNERLITDPVELAGDSLQTDIGHD